ncbi:hypothetical protein P59_167 [Bacillus phage P59]|nr:hypothetical protein P59_167 [Bacillus phage P59]
MGAMEKAFRESQKLDEILGFTKTNTEEETKMTQVKFQQNGEVAVVSVANGQVHVERNGEITPFRPQYTFEEITSQFKANGWEEVTAPDPTLFAAPVMKSSEEFTGLPKGQLHTVGAYSGGVDPNVANSAAAQNITIGAQKEIDEYLELHKQKAEIEKKMNEKKKNIRDYMDANDLDGVKGTNGQQIVLQAAKASNSTSRYTDYELSDVMSAMEGSLLKQVTEIRVNADKLEALLKVEKLPASKVKEIKGLKIVNPGTPRFTVKK